MHYATLIPSIKATIESVTEVKDCFTTPKTKLTKFPAVYFRPFGMENAYETNSENAKTYDFQLLVLVGTSGTTVEAAFGTVLPKVVDALIAKFDSEWNRGTIAGHRVRAVLSSADAWQVSEEQDGTVCYAPMTLKVRLLTAA
jgi:hypothetical protein